MKQNCIICKSENLEDFNLIVKNRYTEEFSSILKTSIKNLEKKYSNLICNDCGVIFKKKWFSKKILKDIYTSKIPSHPRGWDTVSNKLNKKYLNSQINHLNKIKDNGDIYEKNHIIRTILGLIKSLKVNQKQNKILSKFKKLIIKKDTKKINDIKKKIKFKFVPSKFSRYAGFRNKHLYDYINKTVGKIHSYGEIGCPLWGMIDFAKEKKCSTYFIKPDSDIFWGSKCKNNKINCYKKLSNTSIIDNFDNLKKQQLDYLGIYNFLDHYNDPVKFLNKVFKVTKSVGIITEKNSSGIPIQHHNILSLKSMVQISKILNKKVDLKYNKFIKNTDYDFYIFY